MTFDVTAIITMFREGILAHPTIKSAIVAVEEAKQRGISAEIMLNLDNTDDETRDICTNLANEHDIIRIFEHNEDDLGLSRNIGIQNCESKYVTFLDGDDLWGKDWIWRCYESAEASEEDVVWHPEINVVFQREYQLFYHTDMDNPDFEMDFLRINNYWTALSFARRDLYINNPYSKNKIKEGYGFEDWNWNCNTISKGIKHKTAKDTCHFIRKKESGSMLSDHSKYKCIMTPSNLFELN